MNPQISYGADVIPRIQAYAENGQGMRRALTEKIISAAEVQKSLPDVMILAGNTVTTHIFPGIDPGPLGVYPFHIPQKDFTETRAADLFHQEGWDFRVIIFPHFGAYVGGKCAGFRGRHSARRILRGLHRRLLRHRSIVYRAFEKETRRRRLNRK